jgi:protein TonB
MLLQAHRPAPVGEVIPINLPTTVAHPKQAIGEVVPFARSAASFRYQGLPPHGRLIWVTAALVSAGLHAGLLLGFSHHHAAPRRVVVKDEPVAMLMMPELKDQEEKKVEELDNDEPAPPSVQVPMLQDVPLSLTQSNFSQLIDPVAPAKLDHAAAGVMAIPLHIQHGRPDAGGMKDLFNIADLDRKPEPIAQTPPIFPFELKRVVPTAQVKVGFIVTSKGDVAFVYVVSSSHPGFERATLEAVQKWKFRPGMRGGRKVNTRVEQLVTFTVRDDEE